MAECDVFISYKREERPRVEQLANKLKSVGLKVWFDTRLEAGASFDDQIADALKGAKAVLVCWTPGAIASDWVRAEAAMAHSASKLVAAFLAPTELIPPFNLVHAEDLSDWSGEDDHAGWAKILARLCSLSGEPGLVEWAKLMVDGDAGAMRKWVAAQGAGPLRSTARFWLSEMHGAPIMGVAPRATRKRGGMGAAIGALMALVAIGAVGAGGYLFWQQQQASPTAQNMQIGIGPDPAEATPPAAGAQGAVRSAVAAPPPPPEAIKIGDDALMTVPANTFVNFEAGTISEEPGPGFDFEVVFEANTFKWRARSETARIQWDGSVARPTPRSCREVRADYMVDEAYLRETDGSPYQCFVTADGHRGYVRGITRGYDPEQPVTFAVTFFR